MKSRTKKWHGIQQIKVNLTFFVPPILIEVSPRPRRLRTKIISIIKAPSKERAWWTNEMPLKDKNQHCIWFSSSLSRGRERIEPKPHKKWSIQSYKLRQKRVTRSHQFYDLHKVDLIAYMARVDCRHFRGVKIWAALIRRQIFFVQNRRECLGIKVTDQIHGHEEHGHCSHLMEVSVFDQVNKVNKVFHQPQGHVENFAAAEGNFIIADIFLVVDLEMDWQTTDHLFDH